jgi:hypothetical protein
VRSARRGAILGAAVGLVAAGIVLLVLPAPVSLARVLLTTLALGATGGIVGVLAADRSRARMAAAVERAVPDCRNVVITAAELIDRPPTVRPYIGIRVVEAATARARTIDLSRVFPAARAALALAIAAMLWSGAAVLALRQPAAEVTAPQPSSAMAAAISAVTITIAPPQYAGQPARTLTDPARIEALAGSRLSVVVSADAAALTLDTVTGSRPFAARGPHSFAIDVDADADGFLGIVPADAGGQAGVRRLIGLAVTPDRAPRVKVTTPGHDLLLTDPRRTVDIAVDADDDIGLAALALRYTKVKGSGENFAFTDGEIPLEISRTNAQAWTGKGGFRLESLGLEPGDMVIYRGTATDHRPGAPAAESDTFIIEIAAPGALASEGFAIDDREDKYALSQQMVIVKTERLIAKKPSLTVADFNDEALDLAAEQRQVRAEFVFMMGGELADAGLDTTTLNEEAEAAGEEDLAAGRMANQGRIDLLRAIRAMSHAATQLGEVNLAQALVEEKAALTFLQRAFSRSRYILRTLGERERLDLSRRLTGVLAALARGSRPVAEPSTSPRVLALRRALAQIAELSALASTPAGASSAGRAATIAQDVLRVDPAATTLRDVATLLTQASAELTAGRPAGDTLDRAAIGLAAAIRAGMAAAPPPPPTEDLRRLNGALADALRRTAR